MKLGLSIIFLLYATSAFASQELRSANIGGVIGGSDWVNVKDATFGAKGDGVTDDTAAIQAAIDYAFANNISTVYCPTGQYVTSNTLFLDPPTNMRAVVWTGTGYLTAGVLTVVSTTTGSFPAANTLDYITGPGVANPDRGPTVVVSGSGPYTTNSVQTLGSSGSPVNLSATNITAVPQFSFSMSFVGDPIFGIGAAIGGCRILPNFNDAIAFMVGSGQGMRVSDIVVNGQPGAAAYRANQPIYGVGIGIAGGGGGASGTLIQNTTVQNFYNLYETDANRGAGLSDSNSFVNNQGTNGYRGIYLAGTQADVDNVITPRLNAKIAIDSTYSHQVNVYDGNLSSSSDKGAFTITSVSATSGAGCVSNSPNGTCVTATVSSPDANFPLVYDAFTILTPHYGVIPFTLDSWNSSTHVITLTTLSSWNRTNYGVSGYTFTNFLAELNAATTLYAAEINYTAVGDGIELHGTHLENDSGCTTLFHETKVWSLQRSNAFTDIYFNYTITAPASALTAGIFCQQTFPFINDEIGDSIRLTGGDWGTADGGYPILLDLQLNSQVTGKLLNSAQFNVRFNDQGAFGEISQNAQSGFNNGQMVTVARASGNWDTNYFLPTKGNGYLTIGEMQSAYCGDEPCPAAVPNLSPTIFALVCPSASAGSPNSFGVVAYTCGSLGSMGTYPPIPSRVLFRSTDWNTGAANKLTLHSGHGSTIPGWSYGQDLTQTTLGSTANWVGTGSISGTTLCVTATSSGTLGPGDVITGTGITTGTTVITQASAVGTCGSGTPYQVSASQTVSSETITAPSVTWEYYTNSSTLYLDATTMKWMFPGLGFSIDPGDGGGARKYTVTGVYPYLGYVTVISAVANGVGANGVGLQGNTAQVFSCSSSCTIGQAAFSWSAY